ncbi:MAG: VWA domain-containing protein [Gammaproteobacteria bacterium]|nr:VWA domain-containing protein [Pseudomonadales bacterium]MCP5347445.1 VWA domain-containing protein [Pseudomonadales bacterium]
MRNPIIRRVQAEQSEPLAQICNVLAVSLVALILVACGAEVVEDQAIREAQQARQQELADLQPEPSIPAPPAPPNIQNPGDADLRLGPRQIELERASEPALSVGTTPPTDSGYRDKQSSPGSVTNVSVTESQAYRAETRTQSAAAPDSIAWQTGPRVDRENYLDLAENAVKLVAERPVSTFSIDVDTAGYSNIRRMILREGRLPPHDAVRLEEMINYFSYAYPVPESVEQPLGIYTELAASPWNPANRLLLVGVQGYRPDLDVRPAANLVFLVDVSGSMNSPDKLGLVQQSLKLLVDQMRDSDRIALVVYAGAAGTVLNSTSGSEKSTIRGAIDRLSAGGSTNGAAGIELAYRIAEQNFLKGGINRVIIASDGDLNVGLTSIEALKELISKKRQNGIALTTLGFGSGNYNYSLMEQIADVGNGNAAYIDSLNEARKVLVEEMQSTLLTIAKDVKIQVEFNPAVVKEYRLIGYENRLLQREDFVNDKVDAGEVGAGHTVTALYEVTLSDSDGGLIPESRYNPAVAKPDQELGNELAFIRIRHKPADADTSVENSQPIRLDQVRSVDETSDDFRFAAAVAGFGQLLRGGKYTGSFDYDQVLELARGARGADNNGYRSELLHLVELAKLL